MMRNRTHSSNPQKTHDQCLIDIPKKVSQSVNASMDHTGIHLGPQRRRAPFRLLNLTILLFIGLVASPSPLFATEQADLTGTWHHFLYIDAPFGEANAPAAISQVITLDETGTVTGGTPSSGSMTVNQDGSIDGSFTFPTGVTATTMAFLDANNTVGTGVGSNSLNRQAFRYFIKEGGAFTQSDLAGTWHLSIFSDAPSPQPNDAECINATVTFDNNGLFDEGSTTTCGGSIDTITTMDLTLDGEGVINNGSFSLAVEGQQNIAMAKMDVSKTILAGRGASADNGAPFLVLGVKEQGTFTKADLAGTWKIAGFWDLHISNDAGWSYFDTVTINSNGTVTGCTGVESDGSVKSGCTGQLSITGTGKISGTIEDGSINGTMDMSKPIFHGTHVGNEGYRSLAAGLRQGNQGLPPPTLLAPTSTSTTATPTFSWDALAAATWYQIQVNGPTGRVLKEWVRAADAGCDSGTGICTFTPPSALPSGDYRWWVRGWNSQEGNGPWSPGQNFSIENPTPPLQVPTLETPAQSTTTSATPTYSWQAQAAATWYQVQVNGSAAGNVLKEWVSAPDAGCGGGTGTCSYTPSPALPPGDYRWWVRGWNAEEKHGPWSVGQNFSVEASVPSMLGVFNLSGTLTTTSCSFSGDNGTGNVSATLGISNQTGPDFNGSVVLTDQFGFFSGTVTGTITSAGEINGDWFINQPSFDQSQGTFQGTLSGNFLSVTFTGQDIQDTCKLNGPLSGSR